jgi:hypothetical protein
VQVQDSSRSSGGGRRQRPPAEQRVEVVSVDDIGAQPPHGVADLLRIDPAEQQRTRRGQVS